MSEAGFEQKYVKEAFDTTWVVPMGPNVNIFEKNLADFADSKTYVSSPLERNEECSLVWKPMHKQPVYDGCAVYTNGIEEDLFKVGFCLPAGPYVSDEDVKYIVDCIKEAIA